MGQIIEVRVRDSQGRPVAPRKVKIWTREDSQQLANMMLATIEERTARGEGADGPWPAYDPDTTSHTGQRGRVTLRRTGRLLGTLETTATTSGATVRPTAEYARFVVLGTRNAPPRDFLAIGAALEDALVTEAEQRLLARARGTGGVALLADGVTEPEPAGEPGLLL